MHALDALIRSIAERQHGLVTLCQLRELGVTAKFAQRRCAAGQWRRVAPGVYAVGGAPRTFRQRVLAAQLVAGVGAVVSHRTALHLWGVKLPGNVPIEISIRAVVDTGDRA